VLLLAAAALGLFYVLIFPKPQPEPESERIVRPLASEAGPEGYLAVWRWLQGQRVQAVSLRQRYDRLPSLLAQPRGNVLLLSLPQSVPARRSEIAALERWVANGNTVLVLAALDDMPLWALGTDPLFLERLKRITGLAFKRQSTPKRVRDVRPGRSVELHPRGPHPLLAGVSLVKVHSALPAPDWQVDTSDGLPLELASRSGDAAPALWLQRRGAGQLLLCAVASPFSNAAVGLADNARLLANLIAWSLGPGGAVVFDDAHQGLTEYYDGKAFFADPRLHRTLMWIGVLWLLFVLGAQPLRAQFRAWQPLAETTYVEASARYLAAVVPREDAARHLVEQFLSDLRASLSLPPALSVWEWLRGSAAVPPQQLKWLQASYAQACAGERVDLVRVQNLLAQLRRILQ